MTAMSDRPASWRMPSPKEMDKWAAAAGRTALAPQDAQGDVPAEYWDAVLADPAVATKSGIPIQRRRLSEIPRHVLRVGCQRCARVSKSRRRTPCASMGNMRSGRMLDRGCWTRPARIERGCTKRTAAGPPSNSPDRTSLDCASSWIRMAPKYHPTPLSGGDRKALKKELSNSRAMATILFARSAEVRTKGEALISEADKLLAESWNERMWADGGRSIHRLRSTKRSTAAIHGSRLNARVARRSAMSISRPCRTRQRHSSTTWQAGSDAANVLRAVADRRRHFCNSRNDRATFHRRTEHVQPLV